MVPSALAAHTEQIVRDTVPWQESGSVPAHMRGNRGIERKEGATRAWEVLRVADAGRIRPVLSMVLV